MLRCQHGTTADQALRIIKSTILEHGYNSHVRWNGHIASVSIGFGAILHIKGKVTDTEAIIECGGAFGDIALRRCREIVRGIFPNGKVI